MNGGNDDANAGQEQKHERNERILYDLYKRTNEASKRVLALHYRPIVLLIRILYSPHTLSCSVVTWAHVRAGPTGAWPIHLEKRK